MEYCIAGKFGGELNLAIYHCNCQIKTHQYFILAYISRVLPRIKSRPSGWAWVWAEFVTTSIILFGCHIKEIRLLRHGGGAAMLKGPGENTDKYSNPLHERHIPIKQKLLSQSSWLPLPRELSRLWLHMHDVRHKNSALHRRRKDGYFGCWCTREVFDTVE